MKWEGREESEHVEDRRGVGVKTGLAVGGGGILVLLIAMLFGVDPQRLAGVLGQPKQQDPDGNTRPVDPEEERMAKFARTIFRDTEIVWEKLFRGQGKEYSKPTLVLFTDAVESACGTADSAVGPFYCPGDGKVYIDLSFYRVMEGQMKAGGEFARAYVLAHEVGHHVQRLLGYAQLVDKARRELPKAEYNKMSVRLELQADFLAGVWAHHANEMRGLKLTNKDVQQAIEAAQAIGDDTLQRKGRGRVQPEKFTHGSAKQRMAWLSYGLKTGDVKKARLLFELDYDTLMPPSSD